MDNNQPRRAMGARPKLPKVPNPTNELRRAKNRVATHGQQPLQEESVQQVSISAIPPFAPDSILSTDWTLSSGVIGPVYNQRGETCASVVICRLLQSLHNRGKDIALHHQFCIRDLANYVKKKTGKLSMRNLNIAYDYIAETGLLKMSDGSRTKVPTQGLRIKGRFDGKRGATKDEVYAKLAQTPLGISLQDTKELKILANGIYDVPGIVQSGLALDHALLVVAKGETETGKDFLVVQNSWGIKWGNQGYGRICLNPLGKFDIFWPVDVIK